jgi:signal transduction histidine kinase
VPAGVWRRIDPFSVERSLGDWGWDSAMFGASLLVWAVTAFTLEASYPNIPGWLWPLDGVLGFVACFSLWWARRFPLAIGLLLIVPGTLSVSATLGMLAGLYRAVSGLRPWTATAVIALHVVLALPYHLVFPFPGMSMALWIVTAPLIYLLVLSLGLLSRARRLVIEGLRQAAALDRARFDAQLATVRHDEREQIAREMHDVLAHRISLLSVHAGALEYRAEAAARRGERALTAAEIHEAAAVIRENAHLAIDDLRELLEVLRDDGGAAQELGAGRPQPSLADLEALVEEASRAGQRVALTVSPDAGAGVRETVQRTAYRVVQEGLTNARKHAPHAVVTVTVRRDDEGLRVTVANPISLGVTGAELDPAARARRLPGLIPGAHSGLLGLAERVAIDGGALHHLVRNGVFELDCTLPVAAP